MKKTTILFAILLLFNLARAGIRYTYVNEVIPAYSYCDLDNNGDNDFHFYYDANISTYFIASVGATSYFASDSQNHAKAYSLASGMGTYTWYNGTSDLTYFTLNTKYLMVKFSNGTDTFYGWILINSNTGSSGARYVVSYAYNDVPDQTLTPGEGQPTGIHDVPANTFKIQQQNRLIQILTPGNYVASITNLSGEVVLQQNVTTGKIDTGVLPQGIYILTLTDERDRVMNRKIVL